jgi:V8-like Glu-specific endopeptidase
MNAVGRGPKRALAGFVSLLALATASIAPTVPAALARAGGIRVSTGSARTAARFWTPARMARAKPVGVAPRWGHRHRSGGRGWAVRGPALRIAPRAAGGEVTKVPAAKAAKESFAKVDDPTAATYRVNGVIFFEDGLGYARCSGTSVNSPNLSVVITAGHCVNGGGPGGHWYPFQWVFIPGYRYGQRPFGVFPAKWLNSTPLWLREGNENADVGIAVVGRNERGQRLGAAVGGAGFASGLKPSQSFDIHGYPAEWPFDGETQRLCTGRPFGGHDPFSILSSRGPLNVSAPCWVTGGASGGGWTIAGGLLNSVTDYTYTEDPETDYGTYFGREVAQLYREAGRVR